MTHLGGAGRGGAPPIAHTPRGHGGKCAPGSTRGAGWAAEVVGEEVGLGLEQELLSQGGVWD